jgi:hypothetical protein
MAEEKNFENRVKRWLEGLGVYPLGTARDKMPVPPVGYYEKRWGGGLSKSGLPDLHLVVNGISLDVELKSSVGRPTELQKHNIRQINGAGSIAMVLYPRGFEQFKGIVKGVIKCNLAIPALNALKAVPSNIGCDILTDGEPCRQMTRQTP